MLRDTRIIMGMPVTVGIADKGADHALLESCFQLFADVDARFSTYKNDSEISLINAGKIRMDAISTLMTEVFALAEKTRIESGGYFDICRPDGSIDPSGIVKGWAIHNVARRLKASGAFNFFVDAGGDVQASGKAAHGGDWMTGIRHPFDENAIIETVRLNGSGIATSGNYVRGSHIYNPHDPQSGTGQAVSLTVIGPDVLEADRFATAAFAMGEDGIYFIEDMPDLEGLLVTADGIMTKTTGFGAFVVQ